MDKTLCRNNKAFLLRVVGDSMCEAHIVDGDLVLVVPQPVANNGEIVVALVNDEATVKRFYKRGDGVCVAPTFMVGNGIGYAYPAGDEPPRYKIALNFLYVKLGIRQLLSVYP